MQERELPRTRHRKVMKIQVKADNDREWETMLSKRNFRKSDERVLEEAMFEEIIVKNCLYAKKSLSLQMRPKCILGGLYKIFIYI